jgi:hypothetical protein
MRTVAVYAAWTPIGIAILYGIGYAITTFIDMVG